MDFLDIALACVDGTKDIFSKGRLAYKKIAHKGDIDLVTSFDIAVQDKVISVIRSFCKEHSIVAEESASYTYQNNTKGYRWIIDPIDGTTNFAHNISHYALSIALEKDGELILGLVYAPSLDELFYAEKSKGAFRNDLPIRVSNTYKLIDSLIATGFPYDVHSNIDEYMEEFKTVLSKVQGIRRFGVASLDICYTAAGFFDGFWERKLKAWDVAAGIIIAKEAGAFVSNYAGYHYDYFNSDNILVSNPYIHKALVSLLSSVKK